MSPPEISAMQGKSAQMKVRSKDPSFVLNSSHYITNEAPQHVLRLFGQDLSVNLVG
jgi:hypothetical protein